MKEKICPNFFFEREILEYFLKSPVHMFCLNSVLEWQTTCPCSAIQNYCRVVFQ